MIDVSALVEQLTRAQPELIAAYLFGSAARDELRPDSDVDVALLSGRRLTSEERWSLQGDLSAALRRDVDLIDLRAASTVLQMQVVSLGRVVADREPQERRRFEGLVYADYARLNEERREVLQSIARRGSVY